MTDFSGFGLPAGRIADRVNECLKDNQRLIITAAPGAGKSTLLPLTILGALGDGRVIVLEPRRLAARQIACRMAEMLGEKVGETVGYRIRFESKVSSRTRVEVLTEGILTRMLIEDPALEGVKVLIFDEFHERSLNCDLALALSLECQQIVRPDLRLVLMSATLDTSVVSGLFDAPCVEAEGRVFPVEIRRFPQEARPENVAETVAKAVRLAHSRDEGDILAFLPGEAEIRRCAEHLGTFTDGTEVYPLYGMLPFEEQRKAISPGPARRIVLATPVAETSLTIDGVRVVVDSGLYKKHVFDPKTSLGHLDTVRVSRDMAEQRSGRAGRTAPGVCYRLWGLATEMSMADVRVPEILESDLCDMLLSAAAWGESDAAALPWITPPPRNSVAAAQETLRQLGALDGNGRLTPLGKRMSSLPCHPRISRMLLASGDGSQTSLATDLAAVLEDRDPLAGTAGSCDMTQRVSALRAYRRNGGAKVFAFAERSASQYRKLLHAEALNSDPDPFAVGALLALAYPERIARAISGGRYQLPGGDTAVLPGDDVLNHEYLAVSSMLSVAGRDSRILLAAPLAESDIAGLAMPSDRVSWDAVNACVVSRREWRIGRIVLRTLPSEHPDEREVERIVCEAVRREGVSLLDFNDDVASLQRRIAAVATWHPELRIPDLSTESVLARTSEWLPLWRGKAASRSELRKLDMLSIIWSMLDRTLQREIDSLAPTHMEVPTGSRIRLDYRQGSTVPVLKVRLQECFGMKTTPRVDGGRLPVLMELLSPGFKPVQLTTDLESFWSRAYFEVRKDLRHRYPKHSWPDDPLCATPKRGVRK